MNNGTQLDDRYLWFDGDSTVDVGKLNQILAIGLPTKGVCVEEMTPDIKRYNQFADDKITVKEQLRELSHDWNIPEQYKTLDLENYIVDRLGTEALTYHMDDDSVILRGRRIVEELALYKQLGLTDVLRTLIFIINTLQENDVVWGVGRGSSVASYVLYLIGVHDVDSVKYDLNINEFLR